jgi:hypothetical protein
MKCSVWRLLIFTAALGLFGAAQQQVAFAQAGSTGGVIGKQDKSASGGESATEPRAPAKSRSKGKRPTDGSARSKVFENPTINGIRVDRCMTLEQAGCNAPAANHWCRSKGFARATSWNWEINHPTIFQSPQSSVKVCDQSICGAFTRIMCE